MNLTLLFTIITIRNFKRSLKLLPSEILVNNDDFKLSLKINL